MSIQKIFDSVVGYDKEKVVELVKDAIEAGEDVDEIMAQGLIAAMDEVGERYSTGELFVPEMLAAAESMKAGLNAIRPLLKEGTEGSKGKFLIGTVKGDLHDIGKNLCTMMVEGAGFEVIDLGIDVESEDFIEKIKETKASILGLSALLTTTMPEMKKTIELIKEEGLDVKVIVGGAPVSQEYADRIGADGYSEDAPGCVELVKKLMTA